MLAVDWKRYVAGDDWLREKKLAALPEGTRRIRIGLHRIARISDEPLSWQRIAEIARETPCIRWGEIRLLRHSAFEVAEWSFCACPANPNCRVTEIGGLRVKRFAA